MLTPPAFHVMSAPDAAELVGITYRQLDYWGRKGWVVPGHVERLSSSRRLRRYGEVDVLRLGALAHLARSGLDVAAYGPAVGQLDLTGTDPLAVVGPSGELEMASSAELRAKVCVPGRFVVFDPLPLREAFASRFAALVPVSDHQDREAIGMRQLAPSTSEGPFEDLPTEAAWLNRGCRATGDPG